MLRPVLCVFAMLIATAVPAGLRADTASDTVLTARRMEALRAQPDRLLAFLAAMPKGGDLHNHADGSVYAENLLAWAIADGACYMPATFVLDEGCGTGEEPLAAAIHRNANLATDIVRALSMETFEPTTESGHDHFFNAFGKFGSVAAKHKGRVVASASSEAARAGVSYLELMTAVDVGEARRASIEATVAFDPVTSLPTMRRSTCRSQRSCPRPSRRRMRSKPRGARASAAPRPLPIRHAA